VRRALRLLCALAIAGLASAVWLSHVFVEFHPIRAKVVQAPIPAIDGTVRVTTAGFPQLKGLRPPFALIARVKAPTPGSQRVRISFDGSPACERLVAGGASRRVDCDVIAGDGAAGGREVVVSGPATPWTLEYLELATHHGNSTGAQTLFVLPGPSAGYVRPGLGWSVAFWAVLAGLLLVAPSLPTIRWLRVAFRVVAGLVVALLAVVQCSERVSDYRVVIAAGSFAVWLAVLLAPRLWTAGRWLNERAKANAFFNAHPSWRPTRTLAETVWPWAAFAIVIGFFCLPLFRNLGEPEARSDESIYFYAVDRILETGEWLTPRSIADDTPFLMKPPLKFWIVAGGMRSGLLPRDERGQRWFDALFGAAGFAYVYWLGRRLAGPICGVTAVFVLFTLDPLLFEHGLRSNNLEGPLFLCYCGGAFHFARWVEAGPGRGRAHAIAVALYFVLGVMSKSVAAFFLPVVCLVGLAWRADGWDRVRSGWRDWIVPALLTIGLVSPWFIYQSFREGAAFWRVILGAEVYTRFTTGLDPTHVKPWNYYFVRTWSELRDSGTNWVALAGIVRLAVAAVRGESWLSRLVLVWGVLPIVAVSLGTSKLIHYLYPFWPMIGLAAGLVVADVVRAVEGPWGAGLSARLGRLAPRSVAAWRANDQWRRTALLAVAVTASAGAIYAASVGPFSVPVGGATFGSPPVVLMLLVAAVAFLAGGYSMALVRVAASVGVLVLVSAPTYGGKVARMAVVDHPIRALRDCMTAVQQSGAKTGPGILGVNRDLGTNRELEHFAYYYYLSRLGPWNVRPEFSLDETERHLWTPGEQTPVFIWHTDYDALVRHAGAWEAIYPAVVGAKAPSADPIADAARNPLRSGARFNENLAVLLPGPFQACLPDVLAAAGQPLWQTPARRRGR
jgi:hypothetical protein